MRVLSLICTVLVTACASVGSNDDFAPGQVWRLADERFENASVVIGVVESRDDRRVVHVSVVRLPGPPSDLPLFAAVRTSRGAANDSEPFHYIAAGLEGPGGVSSALTADILIPSDIADTSVSIPHMVMYEQELRGAVSGQERFDVSLHSMFDMHLELWRDTEERWPDLNDVDFEHRLSERLNAVLRAVFEFSADESTAQHVGPPPPANMETSEVTIDDPVLDELCREVVDPEPLDPDWIAELVEQGFRPDEIPDIRVTVSNVVISRSEQWGHIWRADVHDDRLPANDGMSRTVCWRRPPDQQVAVVWYPAEETAQ